MVEITIRLPDETWADVFWGWYLDGGGDDGFFTSLEDVTKVSPGSVNSDWDRDSWTITHEPLKRRRGEK